MSAEQVLFFEGIIQIVSIVGEVGNGRARSGGHLMSCQSLAMSFAVVRGDVTVNRITYWPLSEAGTACILPFCDVKFLHFPKRKKVSDLMSSAS